MERIEDVLQRIQNIIKGNHLKSNIDVDLMLDYTRVLYADLLEWKRSFPITEEPESDRSKDEEKTGKAEQEKDPELNNNPDTNFKTEDFGEDIQMSENSDFESADREEEVDENLNDEHLSSENKKESERAIKEKQENKNPSSDKNKEKKDVEETSNAGKREKMTMVDPEEFAEKPNYDSVEKPSVAEHTPEDFIYRDRTVLSFELPKDDCVDEESDQKSVRNKQESFPGKEVKSSEKPTSDAGEVDNKKEDKNSSNLPEFEFKETPVSKDASVSFVPKQKINLDIRRVIGLNDRYLFLNELFQQNKPKYEESMDQFNEMTSFEKAVVLAEKLGKEFHWRKEDETVQSFYTILSKHFESK